MSQEEYSEDELNARSMQKTLMATMMDLRNKKVTPKEASAVAGCAREVINLNRLALDTAKFVKDSRDDGGDISIPAFLEGNVMGIEFQEPEEAE